MSEVKVNKISPRTNCGTVTLGDSGDTFSIPAGVTLTNSGTATGFGPTGAVSWNTTKITADPNPAVSGVGYFADTTSSAFTVTLPAAPSAGDIVALSDYTGTWATNNITVGRNSSNINGAASDLILNGNNTTATLIYVDGTEGWRVIDTGSLSEVNVPLFVTATGGTETTCGDFKIHTFTGPGTFSVSCAGNPLGSTAVDYLVVAGGGAGMYYSGLGGGGAGGMRLGAVCAQPTIPTVAPGFAISATSYPIVVGAGAPSSSYPVNNPGPIPSGSPSSGLGFTATGGGTGASGSIPAQTGGSGGGGQYNTTAGAAGNTPPVSPPQGFPGGTGSPGAGNCSGGGGGGGAAAVGQFGSNPPGTSGNGGAGINVAPIFGTAPQPFYIANGPGNGASACGQFAGGGAGSIYTGTGGIGGIGGGANGVSNPQGNGISGVANTGGGGSGTQSLPSTSGAGGSGIVIIRYKFQ
jgi:hypothetical protein